MLAQDGPEYTQKKNNNKWESSLWNDVDTQKNRTIANEHKYDIILRKLLNIIIAWVKRIGAFVWNVLERNLYSEQPTPATVAAIVSHSLVISIYINDNYYVELKIV